ncbi:transcriptional corepressor SEUSS-like [Nicotiana sylvestris]|uniref:Transcriptional corepressor SEUSS-like n=1 Tax=Nicotiana sylvestris TaxID=4096 RepID=A0A1U7VL65_NICSY|nr:PREDICTED: transcriptional corepressor SEUSS-like [Nicotiana sylvestris]XP_009767098.1 PREDICTED: transcriptional corepressor SEUSS-like [Nicotiana sylvestris]XP_009767099.1 PREDICTED: transcriptional corepressor SEUSS-like [Nicotiana sylvestris]XP_009767100.1 PREDICTED: transcriptional corepressor SEUSS-like [Nicotiana sylvestris]XP_009767102.1 PREDICTED: transcriptional corepressor SEUSS-like [Nicotiana sylvestris]
MSSDNIKLAPSTPLLDEQKLVVRQQHEPKSRRRSQKFQQIQDSSVSAKPFHEENPKLLEDLDKATSKSRPSVLQSPVQQKTKVIIKRECSVPPMIPEHSLRKDKQPLIQDSFPPTFPQMNLASQPPNALMWLLQQQMQLVRTAHEKCSEIAADGRSVYKPGIWVQRLKQYMYLQKQRPRDNDIEFWRNLVAEFFAPNAKIKTCFSLNKNRQRISCLFPQETWYCEICKVRPTAGFELSAEVLPRVCKIKYDTGMLEELLYADIPEEYCTPSGHIVLNYTKVTEESVYEAARVVREGRLKIVFSSDLKICIWEFCCSSHEVLIDRRSVTPQVHQLREAIQKYQAFVKSCSGIASEEFKRNSNKFTSSIRQLARVLDKSLINDLGYTKRYVRCLQTAEIVNGMKDLMDYSKKYGMGPAEAMDRLYRQSLASCVTHNNSGVKEEPQQHPEQEQSYLYDDAKDEDSSVISYTPLSSNEETESSSLSHHATSPTASTATSKRLVHLVDIVESKRKKQMTNSGETSLLLASTEPVMNQPISTTPPFSSIRSFLAQPSSAERVVKSNATSGEPIEYLSSKVKVKEDLVASQNIAAAAAEDAIVGNVLKQKEKKDDDKGKYCYGFETDGMVEKSYYMDQLESENLNGVSPFSGIHIGSPLNGTLVVNDTDHSNNQQFNDKLLYWNGEMDPIDDIQFD